MLDYLRKRSTPPADLLEIIAEVRSRWRAKLVLRGAVRVTAIALALFLLAAYGMEWAKFSAVSIIASRVLIAVALAASVFVLPHQAAAAPRQRRAGGALPRGARAVAAGDAHQRRRSQPPRRDTAVAGAGAEAGRAGDRGVLHRQRARRVEEAPLRRWGATLAGAAVASPSRSSCSGRPCSATRSSAILLVSRSVEAAAPYRIEVMPGNATVPKGADQTITARLQGFDAEDASLMARRSPDGGVRGAAARAR